MNKKWESMKQKLSDNAEAIAFWGTVTTFVVGYFGIVGYAIKKQGELVDGENERVHERTMQANSLRNDALARGAQVLTNPDGSFWIIERDGRVA